MMEILTTLFWIMIVVMAAGSVRILFIILTRSKTPGWARWGLFVAAAYISVLLVHGCIGRMQTRDDPEKILESWEPIIERVEDDGK